MDNQCDLFVISVWYVLFMNFHQTLYLFKEACRMRMQVGVNTLKTSEEF